MPAIEIEEILLPQLRPGVLAQVVELQGSNEEVARLSEMGLRPGMLIRVSRGGITCIVQLPNGSRLCLRPSRELSVVVKPVK